MQKNIQHLVESHMVKGSNHGKMPAASRSAIQGVDPKTREDRTVGVTNTGAIEFPHFENGGVVR